METHEHPLCRGRIVTDPAILGGKPVIKGTRIPVTLVLERLAHDLDLTALFRDYPKLTEEDVKACIGYAHALAEEQDAKSKPRPFDQERWEKALRDAQEAWADVDTDKIIEEIYRAREEGSGNRDPRWPTT